VVDVEIGCFVEAVYDRMYCRRRKVVVNVGIAAQSVRSPCNFKESAHTVANLSSPGSGGMSAYGGVMSQVEASSLYLRRPGEHLAG
jgi:hypothetical protein